MSAIVDDPKLVYRRTLWFYALTTIPLTMLGTFFANFYFFIAKRSRATKKNSDSWQKLTPQEQKIVEHILEEKSNKEIAASLFVSHSTVKTHINNLYKKLEVSSREEVEACFKK